MKFLFVHQNMPGQYRELVQWLGDSGDHDIVFLTQRKNPPKFKGVREVIYKPHNRAKEDAYGLVKTWENAAGSGFGAAMAAKQLRDGGWTPDIIIGHRFVQGVGIHLAGGDELKACLFKQLDKLRLLQVACAAVGP